MSKTGRWTDTDGAGRLAEAQRVRMALLEDVPPAVRRSRVRPALVFGCGAVVAGMLLVVLLNLDTAQTKTDDLDGGVAIVDVVPPRKLTDADVSRSALDATGQSRVELPSGGWVQVADRRGRLAQQYRCKELDPAPAGVGPGHLDMQRPEAEVYLAGGRVLGLEGDRALVYAPNNLLESGDVTGHVVIRLYEPARGQAVADPRRDPPSLVVLTPEAHFDSMIGEVVCPGAVHVETAAGEYDGSHLTLQINDRDGVVQHLAIERTERIRLAARSPRPARRSPVAGPDTMPAAPGHPAPAASAPVDSADGAAAAPSAAEPPCAGSVSEGAAAPPRTQFYRLTFDDSIVIQQGPEGSGRTITGDVLTITFSMEGRSLQSASLAPREMPSPPAAPSRGVAGTPLTVRQAVAMLAVGAGPPRSRDAIAPQPDDDDDIIVTGRGRLVMVPLTSTEADALQPGDAVLELHGQPVRMTDAAGPASAICAMLRHHNLDERTELVGSSAWPVRMQSPQLLAEGDLFWWRDRQATAGFAGPGWLAFPESAGADPQAALHDVALLSVALIAPGMTIPGADEQPALKITWTQSVDLKFDEKAGGEGRERAGQIEKAIFNGNVEVLSDELFVNADSLAVGFEANDAGKRVVSAINAQGSVLTRSLKETGTMRCQQLTVGLGQDARGQTVPRMLHATGDVQAMDAEKTIWADAVTVGFRADRGADRPDDPASPDREAASGQRSRLQDSDVEQFLAQGNVQVVLGDGGRVFADTMIGDNQQRRMELKGKPVLVVYDQLVFERDTEVVITERQAGLYRLDGPGSARIYPQRIQPEGRERLSPPNIAGTPEMTVSWSESMSYDSGDQATGGSLDFRGAVDATATPSSLERNTIKADALLLDFSRPAPGDKTASPSPDSDMAAGGDSPLRRGGRRVRKLMAKGDLAELEARTWATEDQADQPRVFNVAGRYIEYDDQTGEALVVGDGRLIVRDRRQDESGTEPAAMPFGRKGATVFQWSRKLHMTREVDQLYNIKIAGDVSVMHEAMDGATATLTCGDLQVTVRRDSTIPPASGGDDGAGPFDLGGSAELRHLLATNAVYLRTPSRDVQCGQLKLNYDQQLAEIIATPGGVVSILDRRTGSTQQVHSALWNMATDVVTISRGSGAASPS